MKQTKMTKNIKQIAFIAVAMLVPASFFNSCQKPMGSITQGSSSSQRLSSGTEETALLELLDKSQARTVDLTIVEQDLQDKLAHEGSSSKRAQFQSFIDSIQASKGKLTSLKSKIWDMLRVQRLAISSNEVLSQINFLVLELAEAHSLELDIDIHRVDDAAIARDADLANQINNLKNEFAAFKADVQRFQDQVNAKFKSIDDEIALVKSRLTVIDGLLQDYKASSEAADKALALALADLRSYTEKQVVELTEKNSELKDDILKQKGLLLDLFQSQTGVATLANRLCSSDANGVANDTRPTCTGSEPDLYTSDPAMCCVSINSVDCSVLFPSEVQMSARNQCNIMIATIRNHDEQLKAIREVDKKQTDLISGLMDDVQNLNDQTRILASGMSLLTDTVIALSNKLQDIDSRLMIVEFKASRAEAAAALTERAEFDLAWLARRTTDISDRFCVNGKNRSLNQFDYEAARQNWHYCNQALEFLTRAKELVQLAKGYTAGVQSINVDTNCSAQIKVLNSAGTAYVTKDAESVSNKELLDSTTFQDVIAKCTTGGPVLAKAMLLNIVQLLNVIGPDFRTMDYMAKKAKIAQIVFLGKPIAEMTAAERAEVKAKFENYDPTSASLKDSLYGRIERPFKSLYVDARMRTATTHVFPENPAAFPESISNSVYKNSELQNPMTDYDKRVADIELKGKCSNCGFAVSSRTVTDVVISTGGKKYFQYPKDEEALCPIINEVVVMKNSNGQLLPFNLTYEGMREVLTPYLRGGQQVPIAMSENQAAVGDFVDCWRGGDYVVNRNGLGVAQLRSRGILTASTPYGATYAGRGACKHTAVVCVMRDREWSAPASANTDWVSYLNNLDQTTVLNRCIANVGTHSTVRTVPLDSNERARIQIYANDGADAASVSMRQSFLGANTQLNSSYWTLKTNSGLSYGVNNAIVSQANPFYGAASSHSDRLLRSYFAVPSSTVIGKQECTPNQ